MTRPNAEALFVDRYREARGRLGLRPSAPIVHMVRPPPPAPRGPSAWALRCLESARRKAEAAARIKEEREARRRRDIAVVEAYRLDPGLRAVAAAFGISHEAVRNILHREGIPLRHRGSPLQPLPPGLSEGCSETAIGRTA